MSAAGRQAQEGWRTGFSMAGNLPVPLPDSFDRTKAVLLKSEDPPFGGASSGLHGVTGPTLVPLSCESPAATASNVEERPIAAIRSVVQVFGLSRPLVP